MIMMVKMVIITIDDYDDHDHNDHCDLLQLNWKQIWKPQYIEWDCLGFTVRCKLMNSEAGSQLN